MSFNRTLFVTSSAAELILQAAESAAGLEAFHHVGDLEGFTITYQHPSHGQVSASFDEESSGGHCIGFQVTFRGPNQLQDVIKAEGWVNAADACLNYLADALPDVSLRFEKFKILSQNNKTIWIGTDADQEETKPTPKEGTMNKSSKRGILRVASWAIGGTLVNGLIGSVSGQAITKYGDSPAKVLGIWVLAVAGIVGTSCYSCSKIINTVFEEESL